MSTTFSLSAKGRESVVDLLSKSFGQARVVPSMDTRQSSPVFTKDAAGITPPTR